jgi:pSer/pThr/pTyr-binding forkhead associated (FHA) protein
MEQHDTHQLDKGTDILSFDRHPFGMRPSERIDAGYITLPLGRMRKTISWRLVLEIVGKSAGLLPLEIVDDVIVGRGVGEGAPSLDLTALEAFENGVSRQHALLRPAKGNLYLLDLESSNGTYVNGIKLGRGIAHALAVQDSVSLGKLKLTVFALERFGADEAQVVTAQMQRPPEADSDLPVVKLPKLDKSTADPPKTAPIKGRGKSGVHDTPAPEDPTKSGLQQKVLAALESTKKESADEPPGDDEKEEDSPAAKKK